MIRAMLMIGLLAPALIPATAYAESPPIIASGLPPVISAEPMVVHVLAEPGLCPVHPLAAPQPCARVILPDGSRQSSFIEGFSHDHGPALLRVDRLTYDWSQNTLSHPVVPGFRLVQRLN